jgi:4-aminobutyrate aminotransferase-like enzyme
MTTAAHRRVGNDWRQADTDTANLSRTSLHRYHAIIATQGMFHVWTFGMMVITKSANLNLQALVPEMLYVVCFSRALSVPYRMSAPEIMQHPSLNSFFFINSGSEAVEAALKMVRGIMPS